MRRFLLPLAAALAAAPAAVSAQSSPNWSYGYVPTAGQINNAFAKKQDVLTYTPLSSSGGTMGGKLQTAPATINGAGFAVLPGIAPTSPNNGDIWATGVGFFGRVNSATMQFAPIASPTFTGTVSTPTLAITGSGSAGDVSGMSVTAGGSTSTLATRFPLLAPLASPTFTGTVTVPTLAISGSGSTGDVSGTSVTPSSSATSGTLAQRFYNPTFGGLVTAAGATLTSLLTPAQYTIAALPACAAGTKGAVAVVTDISVAPTYRQTGLVGGGTVAAPVFCNGSAWEAH